MGSCVLFVCLLLLFFPVSIQQTARVALEILTSNEARLALGLHGVAGFFAFILLAFLSLAKRRNY
mgnify:CR=1 FL=1